MKVCPRCKLRKALDEFYGEACYCKKCTNAYTKLRNAAIKKGMWHPSNKTFHGKRHEDVVALRRLNGYEVRPRSGGRYGIFVRGTGLCAATFNSKAPSVLVRALTTVLDAEYRRAVRAERKAQRACADPRAPAAPVSAPDTSPAVDPTCPESIPSHSLK